MSTCADPWAATGNGGEVVDFVKAGNEGRFASLASAMARLAMAHRLNGLARATNRAQQIVVMSHDQWKRIKKNSLEQSYPFQAACCNQRRFGVRSTSADPTGNHRPAHA
jgi:hypothetical protein